MEEPSAQKEPKQVSLKDDSTPIAYRAVRGGLWSVGSSYWVIGFGFVANILLTRMLTPTVYGDFALAVFFATLFQLRGKLALGYAFVQQPTTDGATVGTYYALDLVMGGASLVIALVAAPILISFGYASNIAWMMVALVAITSFGSLSSVFRLVLDKKLHLKPSSIVASFAMPVSYLPAFWLALNGLGRYSLIAQAIAVAVVQETGFWFYVWRRMRQMFAFTWRFDRKLAATMVRFGSVTGFGTFLTGSTTQVDNFLLGTIAGSQALGYYDRAYKMAQWPSLLLDAVTGRTALLTYTSLRHDRTRLQKTISMVFWISANLAIPLVLAMFISAPDLVLLLYGPQWSPVAPLLRILLLAAVLRPVLNNLLTLSVALGQPRRLIETGAVQLVALVLIGIPLTQHWGAMGTAIAALAAVVVGVGVITLRLAPGLILAPLRVFGGPVASAVLTVLAYWLLIRLVDFNSMALWLRVVVKFGYSFGLYGLISVVLQPNTSRERMHQIYRLARGRASLAVPPSQGSWEP